MRRLSKRLSFDALLYANVALIVGMLILILGIIFWGLGP